MSPRTLTVLAVITAALLGYVLVFERGSVTSKELADRAGRVLPAFVREKVERITVQRRGKDVVLERARNAEGLADFTMLEPLVAPADGDATDRLLGELEWLSARRTVDASSKEELARYGLEAPRIRVRFVAGGDTHVLSIGGDDVHGDGLYVRVDQEPTASVVPRSLLDVVDHEPSYFRDKELFPELTRAWVVKLRVHDGAREHELEKQGGHWWLGAPSDKRYADEKRIADLLQAQSTMRASRDLEPGDQQAAKDALAAPALRITATLVPDQHREDKKPEAFQLDVGPACGSHAQERYARAARVGGEPRYVCVRASDVALFDLGGRELLEPRLFRAQPNEIERFVLSRGAASGEAKAELAWRRDGTKWKSDVGAPADAEAIDGWFEELGAARALRTLPLAGFEERGKLSLELVEGDAREELGYGALSAAGELPVRRGDEALLVTFPASVWDRLTPLRERFVPRAVFAGHQPSEVVRYEASAHGRTRAATLRDGTFVDAGIDSDRVRELVRELILLESLGVLTDRARPEHGFGAQGSRLSLWLRDGKALRLELGAHTEHGAFAQVDGKVLEVGREAIALIDELAGGPRAPQRSHEDGEDEDDPLHEHHDHP